MPPARLERAQTPKRRRGGARAVEMLGAREAIKAGVERFAPRIAVERLVRVLNDSEAGATSCHGVHSNINPSAFMHSTKWEMHYSSTSAQKGRCETDAS